MAKSVEAELKRRLEEERAKGGMAAMNKYKKLFGENEEQVQMYISSRAKEEVLSESVAK